MREFQDGAAFIAIRAGVPLVPLAIVGLQPLLPMGSMHIRSGSVVLRIGDPIPTTGLTIKDRAALTAQAQEQVARLAVGAYSLASAVAQPAK
jgi:1-acyl-sn-glycerol-3-phosphate acyltransferase